MKLDPIAHDYLHAIDKLQADVAAFNTELIELVRTMWGNESEFADHD